MSEAAGSKARSYRMGKRLEDVEETRRRIVEAAVELHGTVGPLHTTFSGVAAEAGVQRSTVYRHFPDEAALFGACTSHWFAHGHLSFNHRQLPGDESDEADRLSVSD